MNRGNNLLFLVRRLRKPKAELSV